MDFTEKDIEDLIFDAIKNNNTDALQERGLHGINGYDLFSRQLDLGEYGRLDLVGINYDHNRFHVGEYRVLDVGVFEIKRGVINKETFFQAIRYCKGIEDYLDTGFNMKARFEIFLIGTSLCMDDFCYTADFVRNLNVFTVKLDLDKGIRFYSKRGFTLADNKFRPHVDLHKAVRKLMVNNIKKCVFRVPNSDLTELPF